MEKNNFEINHDFIREKILFELNKYSKQERKTLKEATGLDDQYIRNMLQRGESRQDVSFQAIIAFSRVLQRPIEYFIYEKNIYIDLVKEKYIEIPHIEHVTTHDNKLIKKENKPMCALKYEFLIQNNFDPSHIVLLSVDSDVMENTLFRGDEALIDTSRTEIKDGLIYAFNSRDIKYIRLRRVFCQINEIQLIADNVRKYPACMAIKNDINILGQVVMSKHIF